MIKKTDFGVFTNAKEQYKIILNNQTALKKQKVIIMFSCCRRLFKNAERSLSRHEALIILYLTLIALKVP